MGWLRLVGSLKSDVSFAEYSLFYRALLQKRPIMTFRVQARGRETKVKVGEKGMCLDVGSARRVA